MCMKANRTSGFLIRKLADLPSYVKEMTNKRLVRPVLEYAFSVWDPSSTILQDELKKKQNRVARFITGNLSYETGSTTGILLQLK